MNERRGPNGRDGRSTSRFEHASCIPSTYSPYFGREGALKQLPNEILLIVPGSMISQPRVGLVETVQFISRREFLE
jgi:hypothetical protein